MVRTVEYSYIDGSAIESYFVIKKKVRRILFVDYAVRHPLQAVKERKKLWGTLAAVRVHARYRSIHAVVDAFVRSVYGHQS